MDDYLCNNLLSEEYIILEVKYNFVTYLCTFYINNVTELELSSVDIRQKAITTNNQHSLQKETKFITTVLHIATRHMSFSSDIPPYFSPLQSRFPTKILIFLLFPLPNVVTFHRLVRNAIRCLQVLKIFIITFLLMRYMLCYNYSVWVLYIN